MIILDFLLERKMIGFLLNFEEIIKSLRVRNIKVLDLYTRIKNIENKISCEIKYPLYP